MYIRITTNRNGQAYYHLVESYRDQGKVRQRTLLSLGENDIKGNAALLLRAIGAPIPPKLLKHASGV